MLRAIDFFRKNFATNTWTHVNQLRETRAGCEILTFSSFLRSLIRRSIVFVTSALKDLCVISCLSLNPFSLSFFFLSFFK